MADRISLDTLSNSVQQQGGRGFPSDVVDEKNQGKAPGYRSQKLRNVGALRMERVVFANQNFEGLQMRMPGHLFYPGNNAQVDYESNSFQFLDAQIDAGRVTVCE